eukprot:GHVN01019253.1.p1 GENE.GHVN01019253.1~~GHVN01019253.1.p1  ORF type:complete len:628 (-),score=53.20 GHVN01019253.1:3582-5465(-)
MCSSWCDGDSPQWNHLGFRLESPVPAPVTGLLDLGIPFSRSKEQAAICGRIEKALFGAASSGEGKLRVSLLREANRKFNLLVDQIIDFPAARKLVEQIRQGNRRATTVKKPAAPDGCSRGRSLQDALGRLEATQYSLAVSLSKWGTKFFERDFVETIVGSSLAGQQPSTEKLHQTAQLGITLLSFLGKLCIGSARAATLVQRLVPTPVLAALLRLPQSPNWHCQEAGAECNSKLGPDQECDGLCGWCRPVKAAVFSFLLRSYLQPKTGCCGRCPSGSGQGPGYGGLNKKWTCDCGPSCFCVYLSPNFDEEEASTQGSEPAWRTDTIVGLDEFSLPDPACISSQTRTRALSRASSADSARSGPNNTSHEWATIGPRKSSAEASTAASDLHHDERVDGLSPLGATRPVSPLLEYVQQRSSLSHREVLPTSLPAGLSHGEGPNQAGSELGSQLQSTQGSLTPSPLNGSEGSNTTSNEPHDLCALEKEDSEELKDFWASVGKCIADDLQAVAAHAQSSTSDDESTAGVINYALKYIAPCIVKSHASQLEVANLTSIVSSLKQLQSDGSIPPVAGLSIQALIMLVFMSLPPKAKSASSVPASTSLTPPTGKSGRGALSPHRANGLSHVPSPC